MPRIDLVDLLHHNLVRNLHKFVEFPVWHKVNEGSPLCSWSS